MTEVRGDIIAVRPGEELDARRVEAFLRRHFPDLPGEALKIQQFAIGASNLTYLIRCGAWEGVLRRPPFGPLPPRAHDMVREAVILQKLHPVYPLAPRPYIICEDKSVLGAPFYIMERRDGIVVDQSFPEGITPTPALCRHLSELVIDTLVALHEVDYQTAGLADIGRPRGFVRRQVERWIRRYQELQLDNLPPADRLFSWLRENIPPSHTTTVLHNDFKFNNLRFAPDLSRIEAVLDWEIATIGDPMFDLGFALTYWTHPEDPEDLQKAMPSITAQPGFLRRDAFVERYAARTGFDVSGVSYHLWFAYFRLAVILQQIYYRWRMGQTSDERFARFGDRATRLMRHIT